MVLNSKNTSMSKKTIVVADQGMVIFGSVNFEKLNCRIFSNIIDAMTTLGTENFSRVVLQLDMVKGDFRSAIQALKRIRPGIEVILFCRMLQEPVALELTTSKPHYSSPANDYHIYPLSADHFKTNILGQREIQFISPSIDSNIEKKIRILEKLATEDDLTGLKNRRYLLGFLNNLIMRADKENLRITLLVFDIDNFKSYNDRFGHPVGDRVLQQVAKLIFKCIRKQDVVARIGGDEFAVVFWDSPAMRNEKLDDRRNLHAEHPREVYIVSERFRNQILQGEFASLGPNAKGKLTISGGLAGYKRDGNNIRQLFEQADKGLLMAKKQGKNQIYIIGQPENALASQ